MKTRYLGLAIGVVLLAVALTAVGRPRRVEAPASAVAPPPVASLALVVEDGRLTPETTSVPKGTVVRLRVDVRGSRATTLALAGYQDRLDIPTCAPGQSWTGEFMADRPGEDFAWLLDGVPAGRLAVLGSHLVEGHR